MSTSPRCLSLNEIEGEPVGGKALGLSRLIALGLPVPEAFVIVGASPGNHPDDLVERYRALGGAVAVRSSALGEDGAEASFAGQYESVLNVDGEDALRAAIDRCLESAEGERAGAYRAERDAEDEPGPDADAPVMSVVVQRMVHPRAAGVLFTVDPVSGRRDRLVIDAVAGLGEALVSGEVTPDHYELHGDRVVVRELTSEEALVGDAELARLARHARAASLAFGHPLDCEWCIDEAGGVHFVQARPVTQLGSDPRELDVLQRAEDFYTKCNIGEMMPGAVTPLTYSVTGRGIDRGMQRMFIECGAQREVREDFTVVSVGFGHMFLNLSYVTGMSRYVSGSTPEQACTAICGRHIPAVEQSLEPPLPAPVRALNTLRYARFMATAYKRVPAFEALVQSMVFAPGRSARAQWEAIDRQMPDWIQAFVHHLAGSSPAGAMAPALLQMTAQNDPPTEEDFARAAGLLAGAQDVESADIAAGIDRVVRALDQTAGADALFAEATAEEALRYIRSRPAGPARRAFDNYLRRHGHRAVRELELRQPDWDTDPIPLVQMMQSSFRAHLAGTRRTAPVHRDATAGLSMSVRRVVDLAHKAVRLREQTKSLLVRAGQRFKRAYRSLGAQMAAEGLLPDADAVFFLQHHELGELVRADEAEAARLAKLAVDRRRTHTWQMSLVFDEVFQGTSEPLRPGALGLGGAEAADGVVTGKPVSLGVARGRARVVRTLDEAQAVQAGEILIAPITDVGWTPCFSLIGGLATDVGSAVSHGAVVAREYGLPCIVNTRVGTSAFATGDLVELDGTRGVLRRINPDDPGSMADDAGSMGRPGAPP